MAEQFDAYLASLHAGLVKGCSKASVDEIIAEATSHLAEGIEELIGRGMARAAAEEAAIARFGDADSVCRWYLEHHQRPSVWRASRYPLVMVSLSVLFWEYQNAILPLTFLVGFGSVILVNSLLLVTIAVCYRARRVVTGVIALACAALYVSVVLGMCAFGVPYNPSNGPAVIAKWSIADNLEYAKREIATKSVTLHDLREGQAVFQSKGEPAGGVGRFRSEEGYLEPLHFILQDPRNHAYDSIGQPISGISPTYAEARSHWMTQPLLYSPATGHREPYFIDSTANDIFLCRQVLTTLPAAADLPWTTRLPIFAQSALYVTIFAFAFGVIADLSAAALRFLVSFLRAFRKRRAAGSGPNVA